MIQLTFFSFLKVWDYNRFHQPTKQGLCDHPQWKGFLKGLQRVEAVCVWKKGGNSEVWEPPLASLSHYVKVIDSSTITTMLSSLQGNWRSEQKSISLCGPIIIGFSSFFLPSEPCLYNKSASWLSQARSMQRIFKTLENAKKWGKAVFPTGTRRTFMFPAQDHQYFWAWVHTNSYKPQRSPIYVPPVSPRLS